MARKRKKHYSAAERAAIREKREHEKNSRERKAGCRRPRTARRATAPPPDEHMHGRHPDRILARAGIKLSAARAERCRRLLDVLARTRPGLADAPYLNGILLLGWSEWVREPESWRPQRRGLAPAFRSLAEHQLARHPVSPHLVEALLVGHLDRVAKKLIRFVAHVARGGSPRDLVDGRILPEVMTRRMLHHLVNPPRPMPLIAMVRRAQILCHGGGEHLLDPLLSAGMHRYRTDERYWDDVIHWFCRQPDLQVADIGPLCDFLLRRMRDGQPVDPTGRNVAALKRRMHEWHRELAELRRFRLKNFPPSQLQPLRWTRTCTCGGRKRIETIWNMEEILTARDLVAEGGAQRHCVASYAEEIADGECSIWSLRQDGRRRLTIEVRWRDRCVHQVRGKANRLPELRELKYVTAWARRNGLAIRSWEVNRALELAQRAGA